MAYNQEHQNNVRLKHLLISSPVGLLFEVTISLVALFLINLEEVGSELFNDENSNNNPVTFSLQLLDRIYESLSKSDIFQQISLFILWALVGMLAYIMIFRILQISRGTYTSLKDAIVLVKTDHSQGVFTWLHGLHDYIIKFLVFAVSILLFIYGLLICYGLAAQQLELGLGQDFPAYIQPILLSILSAVIGTRVIIIWLCLISARFRHWYCL